MIMVSSNNSEHNYKHVRLNCNSPLTNNLAQQSLLSNKKMHFFPQSTLVIFSEVVKISTIFQVRKDVRIRDLPS